MSKLRSPKRSLAVPGEHPAVSAIEEVLRERIIGQDQAVDAIVPALIRLFSPLTDSSRPAFTALLLGPSGVGKTESARAVARALFGFDDGLIRVDCQEYAHSHEIAKLLGSPPGYIGYGHEPLLSQNRVDSAYNDARTAMRAIAGDTEVFPDSNPVSVILFDEIEKAHPVIWNALLGILDNGILTLGSNTTTSFRRSLIFLTSNVGADKMSAILEQNHIGFCDRSPVPSLLDTALRAARKTFSPELLNRFDVIAAYEPLTHAALERILDRFLVDIHSRAFNANLPVVICLSPAAREFLLKKGTDLRYGARPLRRALEHELIDPLSRLVTTSGVVPGDAVEVDLQDERLVFYRTTAVS